VSSPDMSDQPTEAEIRAAYEAEIKQIRVEQILFENIVTLINMGMRRTGLMPGTEDERDADQVHVAIEGVRAHLPLVEQIAPDQAQPLRDALSQLQLAFVQIGGGPAPSATAGDAGTEPASQQPPARGETPTRGDPGPAQSSGRLWLPGQ